MPGLLNVSFHVMCCLLCEAMIEKRKGHGRAAFGFVSCVENFAGSVAFWEFPRDTFAFSLHCQILRELS